MTFSSTSITLGTTGGATLSRSRLASAAPGPGIPATYSPSNWFRDSLILVPAVALSFGYTQTASAPAATRQLSTVQDRPDTFQRCRPSCGETMRQLRINPPDESLEAETA